MSVKPKSLKAVSGKRWRDDRFLADRMVFWFPAYSADQITTALNALSDDQYWDAFRTVFKANTTQNITAASIMLAEHGWFLDFLFPAAGTATLIEMSNQGRLAAIDSLLQEYYDGRRKEIEVELANCFPHRRGLFSSCFRLHDAGEYEASIPLFLIQADGICYDVYGVELYRLKRKRPPVARKLDGKKIDWIWEAAATPLRNALALARHEERTSKRFNRNLILHGASLEYATKLNSLRAMSLLSYLRGMAEYEEQAKSRPEDRPSD